MNLLLERYLIVKIDKIKESIGYLKVVFGILIAIDISLLAWLFQANLESADTTIFLAAIAALVISTAIIFINRNILSKIDQLEDL